MKELEQQLQETCLAPSELVVLQKLSREFWERLEELIVEFLNRPEVGKDFRWRMVHMCSLLLATRGEENILRGLLKQLSPYEGKTSRLMNEVRHEKSEESSINRVCGEI